MITTKRIQVNNNWYTVIDKIMTHKTGYSFAETAYLCEDEKGQIVIIDPSDTKHPIKDSSIHVIEANGKANG